LLETGTTITWRGDSQNGLQACEEKEMHDDLKELTSIALTNYLVIIIGIISDQL